MPEQLNTFTFNVADNAAEDTSSVSIWLRCTLYVDEKTAEFAIK